jgi:hypothetical protein
MPDVRRSHITMGPSLLNQKTPPFTGPGASLYGPRGPQRASPDYRQRKPLSTEPESIQHHIDDAIARVPDLSGKQKNALRNVLASMCRDISFIRCVHEQTRGPHTDAAAGIPMDQGRPL